MRYRFDSFTLDSLTGEVSQGDERLELQPKAYELLYFLLERPKTLFTREQLLAALWPGVRVTDGSLSQLIRRLRRALGGMEILETLPRRGYRLKVAVTVEGDAPVSQSPQKGGSRAIERATALAILAERGVLLLHGPPGIGKSWLGRTLVSSLGGTVTEVELRSATLCEGVTRALGLSPGADVGLALASRGVHTLWVDDLHHALDEASHLERWRLRAPELRILAASRQVPSLPWPVLRLERLTDMDATALLGRSRPLDPGDPDVIALVHALDHLPLALELAAPRLRLLSPVELCARLQDRFALLRDPEGRSLHGVLQTAYQPLDQEERVALALLSSVEGGVPLQAAEAALEGVGPNPTDLLQKLTDSAWLTTETRTCGTWLRLLDSQREFVVSCTEPEILREGRVQMAAWLARVGAATVTTADKTGDPMAMAWLKEHAEFAAELVAEKGPHRAALVRIGRGFLSPEKVDAQMVSVLADPDLPAQERAGLLIRRIPVLRALGRLAESLSVSHDAVASAEEHGSLQQRVWAWGELARSLGIQGELGPAHPAIEQAIRLSKELGEPDYEAWVWMVAMDLRDGDAMEEAMQRALEPILPRLSPTSLMVRAAFAARLQERGRVALAERLYREWLGVGEVLQSGVVMLNLANLLMHTGRVDEALPWFDEAIVRAASSGALRNWYEARIQRARALVAAEQLEEAVTEVHAVLDESSPTREAVGGARIVLGLAALRLAQDEEATSHLTEAYRILEGWSLDASLAASFITIATARRGQLEEAQLWCSRILSESSIVVGEVCLPLAEAWVLVARKEAGELVQKELLERLASFERSTRPDIAPLTLRLAEMHWLRPPPRRANRSDS